MAARFAKGNRVAWTHKLGGIYGVGATLKVEAATALDSEAKLGTVTKVANDKGTHFEVKLDGGETVTLTEDELIKVEETK